MMKKSYSLVQEEFFNEFKDMDTIRKFNTIDTLLKLLTDNILENNVQFSLSQILNEELLKQYLKNFKNYFLIINNYSGYKNRKEIDSFNSEKLKKYNGFGEEMNSFQCFNQPMQYGGDELTLVKQEESYLIANPFYDTLNLWIPYTGEKKMKLEGHTKKITNVINFRENEKDLIATSSEDKTIRIWDISLIKCISILIQTEQANCIFKINKENVIIIGNEDQYLKFWNYVEKQIEDAIYFDSSIIYIKNLNENSKDNNILAIGCKNQKIHLYDIINKCSTSIYEGNPIASHFLYFPKISQNQLNLITIVGKIDNSDYYQIKVYDSDNSRLIKILKDPNRCYIIVGTLKINDDNYNKRLLAYYHYCRIAIWNIDTQEFLHYLYANSDILDLIQIKDYKTNEVILYAALSWNKENETIFVLDVYDKCFPKYLKGHKEHKTIKLLEIPNNKRRLFASAGSDNKIQIWDANYDKSLSSYEYKVKEILSLTLNDDKNQNLYLAVTFSNSQEFHLLRYNYESNTFIFVEYIKEKFGLGYISCLTNVSYEEKTLIAFSTGDEVIIWNVNLSNVYERFNGSLKLLHLKNKNYLIAYGNSGNIIIFDLKGKKIIQKCEIRMEYLNHLIPINLPYDNKILLATASKDGHIRLFDLNDINKILKIFKDNKQSIYSRILYFRLEGTNILAAGNINSDFSIDLFDIDDTNIVKGFTIYDNPVNYHLPIAKLEGHKNEITNLIKFEIDNKIFLISSSKDKTVRIWTFSNLNDKIVPFKVLNEEALDLLDISITNKNILAIQTKHSIKFLEIPEFILMKDIKDYTANISFFNFSQFYNGMKLALLGSEDGMVKLIMIYYCKGITTSKGYKNYTLHKP